MATVLECGESPSTPQRAHNSSHPTVLARANLPTPAHFLPRTATRRRAAQCAREREPLRNSKNDPRRPGARTFTLACLGESVGGRLVSTEVQVSTETRVPKCRYLPKTRVPKCRQRYVCIYRHGEVRGILIPILGWSGPCPYGSGRSRVSIACLAHRPSWCAPRRSARYPARPTREHGCHASGRARRRF